MLMRVTIIGTFTIFSYTLMAQTAISSITCAIDSVPHQYNRITDINPRYFTSHDTTWTYSGICKVLKITRTTSQEINADNDSKPYSPVLKVHGTVQYDFTYRSLTDTPFSQKDFAQHSVQAAIDFVIRDKYPVKMIILSRKSNSPYFEDRTSVSLQFTQHTFFNQLKNDLNKKLPGIVNTNKLTEIENSYKHKQWELEALQNWINNPARMQEITEAKEAQVIREISARQGIPVPSSLPQKPGRGILKEKAPGLFEALLKKKLDSLDAVKSKTDSLPDEDALTKYRKKKNELEKLLKEINQLEEKRKAIQKTVQDSIAMLKQQLAGITDPAQLKNFIQQYKLNTKELPKGWQTLSAINTIGIGRTWLDYSELTVKNVSLTGLNAELNPGKFYFAAAAGKINYRFRDFIVKNNDQPRQSLWLLRAGIGKKEGNHFILTWYDGKKSLLNSFGNTFSASGLERVIGMSVQTRLQFNSNNYLLLESAKSSFHNTGTIGPSGSELIKKVWNFKDRSNEAYCVSLYSYWPQSHTKFAGYYRKTGEHFQSFNLQPVNVNQVAYQFKVQQSFWKQRLTLDAGIRKNDFSNPFINPGINSKTVFKSLQATLRAPKYPFLSIGYYPSSQLTVLADNIIAENQYNTLSVIASHTYNIKNLRTSSNVLFLKFYNTGADSGFIYYNASSWTINQYLFLKALQLQSGITITTQRNLNVFTLEQSANYQLRKWLTLNASLKHNRVNKEQSLWGGSAGIGILIKNKGTIQAGYDKSYLPGTGRNLLPVDMGRITYYRTF